MKDIENTQEHELFGGVSPDGLFRVAVFAVKQTDGMKAMNGFAAMTIVTTALRKLDALAAAPPTKVQ